MSRPTANLGASAGTGADALVSSRWDSQFQQSTRVQPSQQVQNTITSYSSGRSLVPLHLQKPPLNAQQSSQLDSQTLGLKSEVCVPPHLRGFNTSSKKNTGSIRPTPAQLQAKHIQVDNHQQGESSVNRPLELQVNQAQGNTLSKENASSSRPIPPHLQVQNFQVNNHQDVNNKVNNSPVVNDGMQKESQQNLVHGSPPVVSSAAAVQVKPTMYPVQPITGAKQSNEDAFLLYVNKKTAEATEAKRKAVAKKALAAAAQPQPAQPLTEDNSPQFLEVQSYTPLPRSNFVPNEASDGRFQDFLTAKFAAPATNGKKYVFIGAKEGNKKLPVVSKSSGVSGVAGQVVVPNSTMNVSHVQKVDPHSAICPQGLSEKDIMPLMSKNAEADGLQALPDVEVGFEPQKSADCWDDKISGTGVTEKTKENVRATQGKDPKEEFLDWDGKSWLPPPVDWEVDRGTFDNGFMPTYIREDWAPNVPRGPSVAIDTHQADYVFAVPLLGKEFTPIDHGMTVPDVANSENEQRRLHATSELASASFISKVVKKDKACASWAEAHAAHQIAIDQKMPEQHPYAPAIELYLRPATETDAGGIAHVYNHYALNSVVTEDQSPISEGDVLFLLKHSKIEKLPLIVAVRGRMPSSSQAMSQNRTQQRSQAPLPQFEVIIGIAFAETYCYGLSGSRTGKSRFTTNLQFYVHPEYTRKGVGRSLLDRLIQCLSHGYGARDGYDWMNPTNDSVYSCGGVQRWHRLVIQYATQRGDSLNYEWMKDFLQRYFFEEEGRMDNIARSSVDSPGGAKFTDVVFFIKEASTDFAAIL